MAVFKCKMCGGALAVSGNSTTTTCEYCGSQQTLPRLNDDRMERLYDRANHFRRNNEFDKAMGIYEQILDENNEDAEAYWSIVLCRYGIKYVEDPVSHKRIPTVNRTQFTSIFDDDNYKLALKYADISQKIIYEQEATTINEIQKGILDISQKEEPFDVFICYKETDENGRRTHDSVYANELYHELTQEGFKVFFSRITLEDKLGVAYEPYIFAALNSAKVMVVIGTKAEYFNAVWVKNEWSRYLSLIKKGEKKVLIPAYRDMDPYDLPKEFSHLQAQDMNKLGFMSDLIRGIKKLVGTQPKPDQPASAPSSRAGAASGSSDTEALLKRTALFLQDGDWGKAKEYCNKVLDKDPENGQAYVYLLLAGLEAKSIEELEKGWGYDLQISSDYQKAVRYSDQATAERLKKCREDRKARTVKISTAVDNRKNIASQLSELKSKKAQLEKADRENVAREETLEQALDRNREKALNLPYPKAHKSKSLAIAALISFIATLMVVIIGVVVGVMDVAVSYELSMFLGIFLYASYFAGFILTMISLKCGGEKISDAVLQGVLLVGLPSIVWCIQQIADGKREEKENYAYMLKVKENRINMEMQLDEIPGTRLQVRAAICKLDDQIKDHEKALAEVDKQLGILRNGRS